MIKRKNLLTTIFYEGEPSPSPSPTPTPTPSPTPSPTPTITVPAGYVMMSQGEFNQKMAEQKRKLQEKNSELAEQLRTTIEGGRLTAEEKAAAESRIEQLTAEYSTKEELTKSEIDKLQKKYDSDTKHHKDKATYWERLFDDSIITTELTQAAVEFKAFSPEQIVTILRDKCRKVETVGEDNKPTGKFTTKVKFTGMREGKPVELDLSPSEVLKMMSEMPAKYGNLFQSGAVSGLGGANGNSVSGGRLPSLENLSMEDYAKRRKEYITAASGTKD